MATCVYGLFFILFFGLLVFLPASFVTQSVLSNVTMVCPLISFFCWIFFLSLFLSFFFPIFKHDHLSSFLSFYITHILHFYYNDFISISAQTIIHTLILGQFIFAFTPHLSLAAKYYGSISMHTCDTVTIELYHFGLSIY